MLCAFFAASFVVAAEAAAPEAKAPAATKSSEKPKLPPTVEVAGTELQTRDGVMLSATFYPSPKSKESGKEVVPVILLHTWNGDRKEYLSLASFLQGRGHAVLVPDLRGHGESTKQRNDVSDWRLDAAKFGPRDFAGMVDFDMEALKAYLMEKNNEGELNIEKLCIVGAEMGASVALNWARRDWSWPVLSGRKQGQDVKALVLLSPQWGFPGLNVRAALNDPVMLSNVSALILVGSGEPRAVSEATRLYNVLERYHRGTRTDEEDLFFLKAQTTLQGAKLLDVRGLKVYDARGYEVKNDARFVVPDCIARFIDYRLVKQSYPWKDRR